MDLQKNILFDWITPSNTLSPWISLAHIFPAWVAFKNKLAEKA